MMEPKHFRCDCDWAFHGLRIDPEPNGTGKLPIITVTVVNASADRRLSKRIMGAWSVLRGREHVLSEVVIHRDETADFMEYMAAL